MRMGTFCLLRNLGVRTLCSSKGAIGSGAVVETCLEKVEHGAPNIAVAAEIVPAEDLLRSKKVGSAPPALVETLISGSHVTVFHCMPPW